MAALISLAAAKAHLNVTTDERDGDIDLKVDQASAIVVAHLNTPAVTWTAETVPAPIQAAVLLVLTHLYEGRGETPDMGPPIGEAVERVLVPWRTGALA